jgi:fatty-acyl-CoA synthase
MSADSPVKTWLRALELTAPIARHPERILPVVIAELAETLGDKPALLSSAAQYSYRELTQRADQYARWALRQGIAKGDVVGLLMGNQPEYFAIWLGLSSVGVVVALLNTNLTGDSLGHSVRIVAPRHLILSPDLVDGVPEIDCKLWIHPIAEIDDLPAHPLAPEERPSVTIEDCALYIYTSGTTGLPKAARLSHARILQWSYWFAGMMGAQKEDRMYNTLPMYHSVGGVQAIGAVLVAGGSVVLREKFSARQFWDDVVRWDCTLFQYIGELCRYLLHTPPNPNETRHRIRLACGNGLAGELWESFQQRFAIPRILEFYASTEGGVSLFNVQGKRGSIGHIPPYLAHRFSPALVLFDVARGEPARDAEGFCIRCGPDQVGEAIGKLVDDPLNVGSRFEGYTNQDASEKKILRNVFAAGDAWVRTGDLMRKDAQGYFYFVDRIGDTFRWKGENVATLEVAEAICAFPGVKHANVYGVTIPAAEGRAGMAAVVAEEELDLKEFRQHLANRLPSYARPLFLRIRSQVEITGTFKYAKNDLVRQGYDPGACTDSLYFDNPEQGAFTPLDEPLYQRIQIGAVRL